MADPDNGTDKDAADSTNSEQPNLVTKADDLNALRDSVVDAASVSGALWITYLGVLFYMLIAVGSVTHAQLFLKSPIRLPFMNVDLPMNGFFLLGPGLFLIVHAYVLLHFVMLAGKIAALDQALVNQIADEETRTRLRRQLPANIFVQFLAGPSEVRDGVTGMFLWLIALVSLVIGPVMLLLLFELNFLPFHSEWITWLQRIAVGFDLVLLWLFWPSIALREGYGASTIQVRTLKARRFRRVATTCIMLTLTLVSPVLLLWIATFPGEGLQKYLFEFPGRTLLFDGGLNVKTLEPESPFSSRLVLPKFDAIGEARLDSQEKIERATQTIAVFGRDLQGVNLSLADLRKANFIFSDLTGANLGSARLSNVRLDHADLTNAKLDYADLTNAILNGANLTGANLTNARLIGTDLTDASVTQSQLDKACGHQTKLSPGLTLKPC